MSFSLFFLAKRRFGFLPCGKAALTAGMLALASAPPSRAQETPNGTELARQMIAAYHRLNSFEETSEIKISLKGIGDVINYVQQETFRYKRPALFFLTTSDPVAGTFTLSSDGRNAAIYSAKSALYARRNVPDGLAEAVQETKSICQEEFGLRNSLALTPLSFLLAKSLPIEASSFRYIGLQTYGGPGDRKAYRIRGTCSPSLLKDLVNVGFVQALRQTLDIWIDPVTHLAVRTRCDLACVQRGKTKDGKVLTVTRLFIFDELKKSQHLDPPLDNKTFRFDLPAGATLKYRQRKK